MPAVEEIVMSRPERWARMTGSAARATLTGPNRVVSICARKSWGLISSKNPALKLPALLTSTSRRPTRPIVAFTAASASAGSVVSSLTSSRSSCSPRAAVTLPALRAVATTASPAARAALAMSTPMPRPAPVMSQTFLSLMRVDFFLLDVPHPRFFRGGTVHTTSQRGELPGPDERGTRRDPQPGGTSCTVADMAGTSDPAGVRGEIGAFLSTRRARISPAQAGLPVYRGEHRRVPGLRREEVAVLAGISTEYYTRFEPGNATGVSDSVIDGIAHALQLDDAERAHLLDLIRTAGRTRRPRRRPAPQHVRPAVQRIIDSMTGTPALVLNGDRKSTRLNSSHSQ